MYTSGLNGPRYRAPETEAVQNAVVVLIVEDEMTIRELVEDILSGGGFETELTSSGEEAITLLQADKGKYRALLTDIDLRGKLTGWDVARRARELSPEIPILYMTGGPADQWRSQGVPNSVLLTKPFAPAQLTTAVSQLLNEIPPRAEDAI